MPGETPTIEYLQPQTSQPEGAEMYKVPATYEEWVKLVERIDERIAHELKTTPQDPRVAAEADQGIVEYAEHHSRQIEPFEEAAIATVLSAAGRRPDADPHASPVGQLETDGYDRQLTAVVEDLSRDSSPQAHEAATVVAREIDRVRREAPHFRGTEPAEVQVTPSESFEQTKDRFVQAPLEELVRQYKEGKRGISLLMLDIKHQQFEAGSGESGIDSATDKLFDVLEAVHGPMLSWRERYRRASDVPPLVAESIADPQLASLYFGRVERAYHARRQQIESGPNIAEGLWTLDERLSTNAREAVEYALDISHDPTGSRKRLAADYLSGDIRDYGFSKIAQNSEVRSPNQLLFESVQNFLSNTAALGTKSVEAVYNRCNVVNFNRYHLETLKKTAAVALGDREVIDQLNREGFTLLVGGVDGDHIGSARLFKKVPTWRTIVSEVKGSSDFDKAADFLDERGLRNLSQLTLMGHGGEKGMKFSNWLRLDKGSHNSQTDDGTEVLGAMGHNSLGRLIERVRSKPNTQKREVVLLSCSQAERTKGDLALIQYLAAAHPGVDVIAGSRSVIMERLADFGVLATYTRRMERLAREYNASTTSVKKRELLLKKIDALSQKRKAVDRQAMVATAQRNPQGKVSVSMRRTAFPIQLVY